MAERMAELAEWQKCIRTIYGTSDDTDDDDDDNDGTLICYVLSKSIGPAARESVNGGLLFFFVLF